MKNKRQGRAPAKSERPALGRNFETGRNAPLSKSQKKTNPWMSADAVRTGPKAQEQFDMNKSPNAMLNAYRQNIPDIEGNPTQQIGRGSQMVKQDQPKPEPRPTPEFAQGTDRIQFNAK